MDSINKQLTNWIEIENDYLMKHNSLSQFKQTEPSSVDKSNTKINTGLTVMQLCYFLKLMCDTGVINHPNQKEIIQFIADNFQTEKVDNISIGSIGSKFYSVDLASKKVVRDFLHKMLNEDSKND